MPYFIKIGHCVADILQFVDFSRWWPSVILDFFEHIWTTHREYLVVSITVQSLVMIDPVVSII